MSLQRRLTLFFILIVILPLAVAGFVVQRVVMGEIERRALMPVRPAMDATVVLYNTRAETVDELLAAATVRSASFVRALQDQDRAALRRIMSRQLLAVDGLDFMMAFDRGGGLLAFVSEDPQFLAGFDVPGPERIRRASSGTGAGFTRSPEIPVRLAGTGRVGSVLGGFWLDQELLVATAQDGVHMAMVAGDRIIASSTSVDPQASIRLDYSGGFDVDIGGEGRGRAVRLQDATSLMAWTSLQVITDRGEVVRGAFIGLLVLALAATGALAYFLARLVTQDLDELTRGAQAIAQGRFDHRIPVRSNDEVGQVAAVFNEMTERLSATIGELQSSRDQLERAVRRIGQTLRSTHDMDQILDSVLQTAADAVDADAAVLWKFVATRDELQPVVSTGIRVDELSRIRVGEGIAGLVAERAVSVSVPAASGGVRPSRGEPGLAVASAVPLYSQNRITGVLSVYRRDTERPFSAKDVDTVVFLAEQAGVAIENVALHEEASRLSLTDGLTGIYNRRYFQMQFRQVMATAVRFDRPFSMLMMDLDHFKEVNDTYGHQRGDSVLIEFAHRVSRELREVDTFARWGGEEFMCLLPETNLEGAEITAHKILDVIRSEPFGERGEKPLHVTVSIGVASYPAHGESFRELVEAADKALYAAKQAGRDRMRAAGSPPASPLKLAE